MEGHEAQFKAAFEPYVVEIQNHHEICDENWRRKKDHVHEAYVEENKKTYLWGKRFSKTILLDCT